MESETIMLPPNQKGISKTQELNQNDKAITDLTDDSDLITLVKERLENPEPSFEVNLDDLYPIKRQTSWKKNASI